MRSGPTAATSRRCHASFAEPASGRHVARAADRLRRHARRRSPIGEETGAKKTLRLGARLARLVPWRQDRARWRSRRCSARGRATRPSPREAGLELPDVSRRRPRDGRVGRPAGAGTDFGVPSARHRRRPPADRRRRRPTRLAATRRGGLDGVRARRRGRPGRASQGSARRRPRPRQDRRPRRSRPTTPTPARSGIELAAPVADDRPPSTRCARRCSTSSRLPSDGSPLAGRSWTARYAARRIAWHALDHAWEMEDRSERA